jgi:hypothetical protein
VPITDTTHNIRPNECVLHSKTFPRRFPS